MEYAHPDDDIKRPRWRPPDAGYDAYFPISVSGEYGVINYLRSLALSDAVPHSEGHFSPRDVVFSATRISIILNGTHTSRPYGPSLYACRIESRLGRDDIFFHIVDGPVEKAEELHGWKLTATICNPGLELVETPRFTENSLSSDNVKNASNAELDSLIERAQQSSTPGKSAHHASPNPPELLLDAAGTHTFTPQPITADERAKRADLPLTVRRVVNIANWEIELIAGAILWNRNRIPLASVAGLSWQTRRSEGEGWIRLRVEDEVLEARWDVVKQLSEQNAAQQLVGMLLLELRSPIVEAIAQRLVSGGHEHLGDAVLTKEGVQLKAQGLWRNKDFLCPWREVETEIDGAAVSIKCVSRRVAPVRVGLNVENAFALHFLPSRMFSR